MFYFDPTIIDRMAKARLSCPGALINLDFKDYRLLMAERAVVCAVRVKTEDPFPAFLASLRSELFNAQSAIDEPEGVMIHLMSAPEADVTMENYKSLLDLMTEIFGKGTNVKLGYGIDDSLPHNHKDIMVIVAGN